MGLTHGLPISEQRPRAALMACPGPLFDSLQILKEEGSFICKAKKTKTKGTNPLSPSDHKSSYHFFLEKSQWLTRI
jgi:hypothetical protein